MANFTFNIENAASFSVNQESLVETDCASQYIYKVDAIAGNSINITLVGTFLSAKYTLAGVEAIWDGTQTTLVFNTDLYIEFVIDNSGTPGVFNEVSIMVDDTTTNQSYLDDVIRQNDDVPCDIFGSDGTYDELSDTPENKTGSALKLVRVNASEDAHEYVDPGDLGNDLNFSQAFTSSTSVVIVHNLGKIPSVTVIDGSGNRVHGDIDYTDLNNLTITFNTAFSGVAYLN